jgi:high-affinity iron transporter
VAEVLGQYLITFREVLEAALITAIILAYLTRTGMGRHSRYVWYGVWLAIVASVILGVFITLVFGTLSKPVQALFEGVASLVAVVVLSSMVYWMASRGKHIKEEIERRVEAVTSRGAALGLVSISFIAVFREGLETVLFLTPFLVSDAAGTLAGMLAGVLTSLVLAYAIFVAGMRINIRSFFYSTSMLLILLAGGLAGYGVHELIEYAGQVGVKVGWLGEFAYVLNIPSYSPLHHRGVIGSVLAVMFGYTVSAEWARLLVHAIYLAMALPSVMVIYRKR